MPIARWSLLSRGAALPRSSHCLSVSSTGRTILYGGELKPRTPVDSEPHQKGAVHTFDLSKGHLTGNDWETVVASADTAPEPRVGAATAILDNYLYLWGGRGGADMAPIPTNEASTGVWRCFLGNAEQYKWERLSSENGNEGPQPRSYHTMVSFEGKLYIHAGCPSAGRLSELHSFDVISKSWKALAPAPDPGRGGTVLALTTLNKQNVFLRFAGFAGYELGADHSLDIYDIASNTWRTVIPRPDDVHGYPGPRSVHGFVGFSSSKHTSVIALLYHGERDASTLGHAGAGTFWSDVWMLETNGDDLVWKFVPVAADGPEGRGWFPAASWLGPDGNTQVVMQGGLLSSNERSGELWLLDIDD